MQPFGMKLPSCVHSPQTVELKKEKKFKKLFFVTLQTLLMKAHIHQSSRNNMAISTKALKILMSQHKNVHF